MMDWFLNFKLWENANAYCIVHKTVAERIERARRAVVSRAISRGALVLAVDFRGDYKQPLLASVAKI